MRKAQIGFIGAGSFISYRHLPAARDSRIMEIRVIADLDEQILKKYSSSMPVGYTTTDYKKVLSDPKVDIVIIGTKQDLHAKFIIESLDAGKWVLCEKPMSQNDEESQAVLAAERRNRGKLAIGFNRRFATAYADAKLLMKNVERPWYINYRLMSPNPDKHKPGSFYEHEPRIHYEGCHIIDLICWFLEETPKRVFMTGDKYFNNCCILDFPDGSQVSFMCGSMGTVCYWKEYMEIFSHYHAITISDFVDMRVRGFKGEFDRIYPLYYGVLAEEILKYGFDFYEVYGSKAILQARNENPLLKEMELELVRRPVPGAFDLANYDISQQDYLNLSPEKGWVTSLEHFAQCFLDGSEPHNADGKAGALSTQIADALIRSLDTGTAVEV